MPKRLTPEQLAKAHDGLCGISIGDGDCSCIVHWVSALQKDLDEKELENDELKRAIGHIHQVLGTGACKTNKCEGCDHEMGVAASAAQAMWDKYIEKRNDVVAAPIKLSVPSDGNYMVNDQGPFKLKAGDVIEILTEKRNYETPPVPGVQRDLVPPLPGGAAPVNSSCCMPHTPGMSCCCGCHSR